MLVSCSVGQRYELQVLQNNALRLCKQYRLLDRITKDRLHSECKILGLEQRRRDDENTKKTVRRTRAASKYSLRYLQKVRGNI